MPIEIWRIRFNRNSGSLVFTAYIYAEFRMDFYTKPAKHWKKKVRKTLDLELSSKLDKKGESEIGL